jgi:hypothetical protein
MGWTTMKVGGYTVNYLRQTGHFSCAPSCVAMILGNLGPYKADGNLEKHTRQVAFSQVRAVKKKYGGEGSDSVKFQSTGMTVDQIGRLLGCYHLDGMYYHGQGAAQGINSMGRGEAALFASEAHVVCLMRKWRGIILLDPIAPYNCGFKSGSKPAVADGPGCVVKGDGFGYGGEHLWRIRCPSRGRY